RPRPRRRARLALALARPAKAPRLAARRRGGRRLRGRAPREGARLRGGHRPPAPPRGALALPPGLRRVRRSGDAAPTRARPARPRRSGGARWGPRALWG